MATYGTAALHISVGVVGNRQQAEMSDERHITTARLVELLETELAGLALHAWAAKVPLASLDQHFPSTSGGPALPQDAVSYARLLRYAIADLRDAAIAMGHAPEIVESWGPLPVATVLATGERLLR